METEEQAQYSELLNINSIFTLTFIEDIIYTEFILNLIEVTLSVIYERKNY